MKKILMSAIAFAAVSCAQNPFMEEWDTPFGIPPFEKIKNEHYMPALKEGMKQQNAEIQAIIDNPAPATFENVIVPLESSGKLLARTSGVLFNLCESDSNPQIEEIVAEALPLLSEHSDNISMNPALFAKVKEVWEQAQDSLNREQQMVLKNLYEDFINNGIGLPEEQQARLKEINAKMSVLQQQFGNNILAENNAYAEKFGTSVSEYYDKMAVTPDRSLRKQMFEAYSSRCNSGNENDNKAILLEILRLRQEKAKMLGYDNPAQWILHNKMAKEPANVNVFLDGIMKAAVKKANAEVERMKLIFNEDVKSGVIVDDPQFRAWDYLYYAQKVKEQDFALNEDEIKPYFKMENVRDGVFSAAGKLYGISFRPIENCPKYHPDVEGFEVIDQDSSLVGVILTDYFPRESKRGGAWMTNFRDQSAIGGEQIRPVIVNVGNFNKPTADTPSLLSIDNVETMFHEFGHALHGLLSNCTYPSVSGTSVARDFVELPSQINENWAFEPELLKEYALHYQTGEVIPAELVDKIIATSTFNQGFWTTELCAASILDMKWHEMSSIPAEADADPAAWVADREKQMSQEMGLPDFIIPRYRTTYFNHIFNSGYAAGYYSYLWAEVLDKDAFQAFVQEGIFNRETGMRFRNCILSRGESEEPMTLYREFRGADPNPEYLLKARGLE